jgi:hypothetical protein
MPQWPNAYEGPLVAENGVGTFGVGLDDFGLEGPYEEWTTRLYIAVGAYRLTMKVPLKAATWYHLAVVVGVGAAQRKLTTYVDGVPRTEQLSVPAGAADMPQGTLRFGKRTNGKTVNQRDAQYYGLLDDVAVSPAP